MPGKARKQTLVSNISKNLIIFAEKVKQIVYGNEERRINQSDQTSHAT